MSDSEEDLSKKWEGKKLSKKKDRKGKKGNKKDTLSNQNIDKQSIDNKLEIKEGNNINVDEDREDNRIDEGNVLDLNNNYQHHKPNYNIHNNENTFENEANQFNYRIEEVKKDEIIENDDNPYLSEEEIRLSEYINNEEYGNFFQSIREAIKKEPVVLRRYKDLLLRFYKFFTKITIKTSTKIVKNSLSDTKFIDIKIFQQENNDIPLKNLNQLIQNNYCFFKKYDIDLNNPHAILAVFFYMICDKAFSNLVSFEYNLYIISDNINFYNLDRIKDLNHEFLDKINANLKFCIENKQEYKAAAFENLNFFAFTSNKLEDYNIAATIMKCYLLNILIDTSYDSMDKTHETDYLYYDSISMVDLIEGLVNENCLTLEIISYFFKGNKFDYYNSFIQIDIKDENFNFNSNLKIENEENSNNIFSIINDKLFVYVKSSDIDRPENNYKPFDLVPFSKKFLEFSIDIFDKLFNMVNNYIQKYQDFTCSFPNYNPNLTISFDKLLEVLKKLQEYVDEKFEVEGSYQLASPYFFLNDKVNINQLINHYNTKHKEEKNIQEEFNSYGIQEINYSNYCKRCYDNKYKVITLSCNHEICEECIRNYVSYKTNNIVLVKYSKEGVLNCFKCPNEDCSIFMKRNEIFSPFSIYANSLSKNYNSNDRNNLVQFLNYIKGCCFICGDKSNIQVFHHENYQHLFCYICLKKYIQTVLGTKIKKHMNIYLVFPQVISCPVPMCRCSLDINTIQNIFHEEFVKANQLRKLSTKFENFKKSNFLVGSFNCFGNNHHFPQKIFNLIVETPKNQLKSFTHNCEYCPSCYSFYWFCLSNYENTNNSKAKISEESTECLYCGMYLPNACFENGFENTKLYKYTQDCQNCRDFLLNKNVNGCCEDNCSEMSNLINLSDSCKICSNHFKELSIKIGNYQYDKSVIKCKKHRTPYDESILKMMFPNFSPNIEINFNNEGRTFINKKPIDNIIRIKCILDNIHEATIIKTRKNKIIVKCEDCHIKICCYCGFTYENDSHMCELDGEDFSENFERNGFWSCHICNLFTFPQGHFVYCSGCTNELCVNCRVPKYLVNSHGTCMHRCDLKNDSSGNPEYNENCLACIKNGDSCFYNFYGENNQFLYINQNNKD